MDIDYSDFSWHIAPPNSIPQKEVTKFFLKSQNWHNVMPSTISRWRKFIPSRRIIMKELGKPPEDCTNEEIARFITTRGMAKQTQASVDVGVIRSVAGKKQGRRDVKVDDLLKEYLTHYHVSTPNDLDSLRQLCSLKLAIDDLEATERQLLVSLRDPHKQGKFSEAYINSIVNARLKYSSEYRQLQTMLGIDRPSREKAENEKGGADYMRQLMQTGANLLDTKSVPIRCPNCLASTETVLQMGFVLCHFENWKFSCTCPRCEQPILLQNP